MGAKSSRRVFTDFSKMAQTDCGRRRAALSNGHQTTSSGGQGLMDGSQGREELAVGMGITQAEGSDLFWYWCPALQHRMLPEIRKHTSYCSRSLPEGQGNVDGGMLHMGITGLRGLKKHQMTQVQVRGELSS